MLRYENKTGDPRYLFKNDLKIFVKQLQLEEHYIIIMGDFNDHMQKNRETFSAYIKDMNLLSVGFILHIIMVH